VLCYHGQHIYEAKCTKVDTAQPKEKIYFVHYNGWNKKWDEWVDSKRIMKYTDENLAKQQEILTAKKNKLKNEAPISKKEEINDNSEANDTKVLKRKRTTDASSTSSSDTSIKTASSSKKSKEKEIKNESNKKRVYTTDIYSKHNKYLTNPKIRVIIPKSLKDWLIDDFDAVTQQNKLVNLPSSKTLKQILDDYKSFKINQDESIRQNEEFSVNHSGIIRYFNVMLGSQLLYKFERVQYSEILESKQDLENVYGAIHLLRLFEKLDQIISFAPLDPSKLESLMDYVNDLLIYLEKLNSELFSENNYIIPPPHYIRASY